MRSIPIILAVSAVLGVALPVHAEDVVAYQTEGEADAAGGDAARIAALDEAFGKAVSAAINDVVVAEVRKANKPAIDREILGHARLWVAKFTVTKDETRDDRRQLTVSVRVDRDKMRARLGELKIEVRGQDPAATTSPGARTVTVLLRVTQPAPAGVSASFVAGAGKDVPGLAAISAALRTADLAVKRAPTSGTLAPRADGELPISQDEAGALADAAKAELAVIAGVEVSAPVIIRGVPGTAALVTAHVWMLDRAGEGKPRRVTGQGTATMAARGRDSGAADPPELSAAVVGAAIDRALVLALADVLPPARSTLTQASGFHGTDTPVTEPGVVLVRLAAGTPWGMVAAEQKYLTGARGITRAVLRHVSGAGWVIGVTTTESIEKIAAIAKKSPAPDVAASVKTVGEIVEVTLSGAP